jgi:hypothetical protein
MISTTLLKRKLASLAFKKHRAGFLAEPGLCEAPSPAVLGITLYKR